MENRKCKPSFADLIDMLTIQQIKEVFNFENIDQYEKMISDLMHDINLDIQKEGMCFCSMFVRQIIALSQINLLIWKEKEDMMSDKENYCRHMKLSHQLNGIRNQLRNKLMEDIEVNDEDIKTNVCVDGLEGWKISL